MSFKKVSYFSCESLHIKLCDFPARVIFSKHYVLAARFGVKWMWVKLEADSAGNPKVGGGFSERRSLRSLNTSFDTPGHTVPPRPLQRLTRNCLGISDSGECSLSFTYCWLPPSTHIASVLRLCFQVRNSEIHKGMACTCLQDGVCKSAFSFMLNWVGRNSFGFSEGSFRAFTSKPGLPRVVTRREKAMGR